jgi:hypothetical protein
MIFVIPMAGESRRFRDVGYGDKVFLKLGEVPLFDMAVGSFARYFSSAKFLFVLRAGKEDFVKERCRALGIGQIHLASLAELTSGQAESVIFGLDDARIGDREPITIFNIDTFRPGYRAPSLAGDGDLEVFEGEGANWSFVAPDPANPGHVLETSEKRPISRLCCTGLYRFAAAGDFRWAYRNPVSPRGAAEARERYVAPLYNALIGRGADIRYTLIDRQDVIFCGTPEEYESLQLGAQPHA